MTSADQWLAQIQMLRSAVKRLADECVAANLSGINASQATLDAAIEHLKKSLEQTDSTELSRLPALGIIAKCLKKETAAGLLLADSASAFIRLADDGSSCDYSHPYSPGGAIDSGLFQMPGECHTG
jgi:hypothetical protein